MFTVIFVVLVILACSWVAMKWMYPRPPQGYYGPKLGERIVPRQCDYCQHTLAEWRGIVEGERFFCNDDHQSDFHAGKQHHAHKPS